MKKITLRSLLFLLCCLPSFLMAQEKQAQVITKCYADQYNAGLLESNPNMMGSDVFKRNIETKIAELEASGQTNRRVVISIPLVVHVLHNGEPIGSGPNISDAQVLSQVTVMNEDFRMMMGTPGESTQGGVDVEVEFVMAQRTPGDCPTNGINRVNICQDGTDGAAVNFWKQQTFWNASDYMNMWSSKYVGDLAGILGFAQFPGGPAATDGVSAGHTYFGSSDYDDGSFVLSPPYDKGRTMTHEVGHYLGLYHTFQGGCNPPGDEVDDTPAVASPNYGCTPNVSCASADMIQNYMDYTDDTCMNTYTDGQKTRVQAVLATAIRRNTLGSSLGATPPTPVSDDAGIAIESLGVSFCGTDFTPTVKITNWGTSALTSANVIYDVDSGASSNYNWNGSLASGASASVTLPLISSTAGAHDFNVSVASAGNLRVCNDTDSNCFTLSTATPLMASTDQVHLTLITDDYGSETTWEFIDGTTIVATGGPYANNTTINESFPITVPGGCFAFKIYDAYGDGICCGFGNGSYELKSDDNTILFTGGTFTDSETTVLSVQTLSVDDYFINNGISIYPNPTKSVLNIDVANGNELPDAYKIYTMLGQLVNEQEINAMSDLTINASALSNGMYFIRISKENNSVSLPFIKK